MFKAEESGFYGFTVVNKQVFDLVDGESLPHGPETLNYLIKELLETAVSMVILNTCQNSVFKMNIVPAANFQHPLCSSQGERGPEMLTARTWAVSLCARRPLGHRLLLPSQHEGPVATTGPCPPAEWQGQARGGAIDPPAGTVPMSPRPRPRLCSSRKARRPRRACWGQDGVITECRRLFPVNSHRGVPAPRDGQGRCVHGSPPRAGAAPWAAGWTRGAEWGRGSA